MRFHERPELRGFLSTYIFEAEPDSDQEAIQRYVAATGAKERGVVISQIEAVLGQDEFSLDELGSESNRWFGSPEEARGWFGKILDLLRQEPSQGSIEVKDSNGNPLYEGDTVMVIKDLKVKGGSSDLKRGTLVKKIHLIADTEAVECRVDGSTLVLKTCFLKKV